MMKDLQKILDMIRTDEEKNANELEDYITRVLENRVNQYSDGIIKAYIDDVTFWKAHAWVGEALRKEYQQQGWTIEHKCDGRGDWYYTFTREKNKSNTENNQ